MHPATIYCNLDITQFRVSFLIPILQNFKQRAAAKMTTQFRSRNTVEVEVEKQLMLAERDELEAAKLELQADRAEFRAEKLKWQVTKGGSNCDCQATKAGLKAERLQLETEKTQLRVGQSQLKAAQSQLEAAKSQLETAQTQLEKAKEQLEIATKHLEAAKAQTDIDNTRLEAAKASLEAAKLRFGAATKQLNAAKSRFEAAKTRFDLASSSIEAEKSHLQDEKAVLEIKVSEVESEKAKLEVKVSELENDKFELGSELHGSKSENESLIEKMKEVVKKLEQCCKDKKALQEAKPPVDDTHEKVKPDVQSVEIIRKVNVKKVFLDLAVDGKPAGRLVIELDFDATPLTAENFRALCTGERGVNPSTGMPLHYKGSKLVHEGSWDWLHVLPDGRTDDSVYGSIYPKENLTKKHSGPGVVSMSARPGRAGFFITDVKCEQVDGEHVVFGQVVEGMNVMVDMGKAGSTTCVIADCGQVCE